MLYHQEQHPAFQFVTDVSHRGGEALTLAQLKGQSRVRVIVPSKAVARAHPTYSPSRLRARGSPIRAHTRKFAKIIQGLLAY
jgi:hypothetical protein